jgi:hypothetical protein
VDSQIADRGAGWRHVFFAAVIVRYPSASRRERELIVVDQGRAVWHASRTAGLT